MKLDLSCPIELRGYTLSYTETEVCAAVRLYNLSSRRIASFEAVAKWHSSASNRSTAAPFCAERLRAGGENGFKITLTTERMPDADSLDILFTRVSYEDGLDEWRCGEGMIVDVAPLPAIPSDALAELRSIAGVDAVCYPRQDSQVWRCVCGRTNLNSADKCARCHRDHFEALGYTPEAVAKRPRPHPSQEEPIPQAQLESLHADFVRQRTRLLKRTLAAALALLALAAFCVLHLQNGSAVPAIQDTASLSISK